MNYQLVTAISQAVTAALALFVSIVALLTSVRLGGRTIDHNRLSVTPLPFIRQPNFEDLIGVFVENQGTGPMILKSATAIGSGGRSGQLIDVITDAIPPHGIVFSYFTHVRQKRPLRPGDEIKLLELKVPRNGSEAIRYQQYRDQLRKVLSETIVELEYTDVYRTPFEVYRLKLESFSR